MIDIEDGVKKLYKDALYFHLIRNGYSTKKANEKIKKIF